MNRKVDIGDIKALDRIRELVALRGTPEQYKAWEAIQPFLQERMKEIPQKFFELANWADSSKTLDLILNIIKSLTGNLSVNEIAQRTVRIINERLGFGVALVSIFEPRQNHFIRTAQVGIPEEKFRQLASTPVPTAYYDKLMNERFRVSQSYLIRWWHKDAKIDDDMSYTPPEVDKTEWNPDDILLIPAYDNSGKLIGVISVDMPPMGKVPDRSLLMSLEILAAEMGKAIDEARIYEKTERRLAQMEILYDISSGSGTIEEETPFLRQVCQMLRNRSHYLWVGILLTDSDTETLYMAAQNGLNEIHFSGVRWKIGREGGIAGKVAASGHYKIINNLGNFPQKSAPFHRDARAQLAVPIRKRDKVLGVIVVEANQPGAFSQEDRRFLRTLANQVASVLSNIAIMRVRNEELRIRRALFEVGTVLSSILEPARLLRKTMDILRNTFNYTSAAIFLLEKQNGEEYLILKAFAGRMDKEVEDFKLKIGSEGVVGFAASMGKSINVPDVSKFPMYITGFREAKSELAVPIIYHDDVLGVIDVESERKNAFGERDERLLELLASEIAVALINAQLYEKLEGLAVTDGLTGLYNYRAFMESLGREVQRASRLNHPFSLLFADIDYFKKYNDTFGHPQGDEVLKLFADVVRKNIREEVDLPARYGGEEFAIILPEIPSDEAVIVADRIRNIFASRSEDELLRPVTVSFGVATFPENGTDTETLLQSVDDAMYRAKSMGRNRVCVAENVSALQQNSTTRN